MSSLRLVYTFAVQNCLFHFTLDKRRLSKVRVSLQFVEKQHFHSKPLFLADTLLQKMLNPFPYFCDVSMRTLVETLHYVPPYLLFLTNLFSPFVVLTNVNSLKLAHFQSELIIFLFLLKETKTAMMKVKVSKKILRMKVIPSVL